MHDNVSVTFLKRAEKNSEQKADDELWTLYWTAGLFPFSLTFPPVWYWLYIYVQGHYLLLLFSETLKLKLVFVPVKKNNRVSSSNVFHLDFTPEKKTTEIIWLFSVVCFPISVFVVEVFHRNTESKSKRTKWCDPRLVALSSTGTICLSPDHDISQYELWKSSTMLENADIFHQMTWITTMIL